MELCTGYCRTVGPEMSVGGDFPAIRLEGARVERQGRTVLDISLLEVGRGEFMGVIGPNGSGKSTLLGVLSGRIRLAGGEARLARTDGGAARVALAAQMSSLDPRLPISVMESVLVGCYAELGLLRRPGQEERRRASELLELVGIPHLAQRPIGQCSGGEAQRAALARALLQRPDVLLLDEPTSALDWRAQREILACVKDIHAAMGLTTLMVTHELNSLPALCDRVLALKGGQLAWDRPATDALDAKLLGAIFDVPFTVFRHEERPVVLF